MNVWIAVQDFAKSLFATSPRRRQELEEAKEIFYSFDCNSFYMMKEGASKNYEKYHVGIIQEKKWRDVFVAGWLESMSKDGFSMRALWHIRNAGSKKAIPALMSVADNEDSYAKYWIADVIWWLSKDFLLGSVRGRMAAIALYESLLENQITISDEHRVEIGQTLIKMFGAETPQEYILNRAKQDLVNIRKRIK